jgi:hypothetical protein
MLFLLSYYFWSKLHETGKRFQVSKIGTVRNRPPKNGNVRGNAVYKKIKKKKKNIYIYIYIYIYYIYFK